MGGVERAAPLEIRAAGRTLTGEAVRYGEAATDRPERFEPGAFAPLGDVSLNLQHDRSIPLASTGDRLILRDTARALEVRATLPDGAALTLLQRGTLRGLSVEFRSVEERRDGGIRVIERATLEAIGLVDSGSYAGRLEVRRRGGGGGGGGWSGGGGGRGGYRGTMRSMIPTNRRVACDCAGDPLERFAIMAAEGVEDAIEEAVAAVEKELGIAFDDLAVRAAADGDDIVAAWHTFAHPLASARKGTLRLTEADGGLGVEIDLPDTTAGQAVIDALAVSGVVVRPLIDRRAAVWTTETLPSGEQVAVYSKWPLRGIIVSATDRREGWPNPTLDTTGAPEPEPEPEPAPEERRERRRVWL